MSRPERKWVKGQGPYRIKYATFRQEGKADQ